MLLRKEAEEREAEILSPYATLSCRSRGRRVPEKECLVRTCFQRDRDRIIHSKSFRRLKHKTQVFISPEGDHYRMRLTHTLEVAQIARTIARALRLNEDLTEAIALGHDLGHTPFGHSGEEALNEVSPRGFRHNEQSLRVVDVLEGEGGLNLTWEVRDGILNHTGAAPLPATLEGQLVRIADRIAYINHDIDDALRAGIIRQEDLPQECLQVLGRERKSRINKMVTDLIMASWGKKTIQMSPEVEEATLELRSYLFAHVYTNPRAKGEEEKAKELLKQLYRFYLDNPQKVEGHGKGSNLEEAVVDYIAGMTDRFAVKQFNTYFVPAGFKLFV